MYPYYRGFCHRGGSRILWFIIGAATAGIWMRSHEAREWKRSHCWRDRIPQEAYPAPGTFPPVSAVPAAAATADANQSAPEGALEQRERRWSWNWQRGDWDIQNNHRHRHGRMDAKASADENANANGEASPWDKRRSWPPSGTPPTPMPTDKWEEERQRIQDFGNKATDTISDMSEATLETLLSTVQSLKAKLAETRAKREEEMEQLRNQRFEQFKEYEEWKRQQQQEQEKEKEKDKPRHIV